jgi:hypothetical protein
MADLDLVLSGLRGSHPLGALAAFGLLRVLSRVALPQPVKLSWVEHADWVARLTFPHPVARQTLIRATGWDVAQRGQAPELTWRDDLKAPLPDYHAFAAGMLPTLTPEQRQTADFLAAFGSELVAMRRRPETRPTALDMTSGQQRFLRAVRALVHGMAAEPAQAEQAVAEALWGPWRYRDPVHALGWDPHRERLHAYAAQKPTQSKARSVKAAVWLGFEALPLFPTAAVAHRLQTGGFNAQHDDFSWPIWEVPLTLAVVRSVLSLAELVAAKPSAPSLQARGIIQVYRSRRSRSDRGYGLLRPSTRVV